MMAAFLQSKSLNQVMERQLRPSNDSPLFRR
jgi:hypothetical protein